MRKDMSEEDDDKGYDFGKPARKDLDGDALQKGNSLDYYNEDLSRKAVGRLFTDDVARGRDESDSGDGFVKGFSERPSPKSPERAADRAIDIPSVSSRSSAAEESLGEAPLEHKRERYDKYERETEKPSEKNGDRYVEIGYERDSDGKEYEKRQTRNPERASERNPERNERTSAKDDDDRVFDSRRKNKSRPGSTPEPSPAVRVSQNKAGTAAGSGQNPGRNPGKVMSNEAYAAGKRKPLYEDGDPKGSSGDDYSGFKRKYDERDYFTAPRKTAGPGAAPGSSRPAAAAGSSRKTPPQDDYEYEETESSGLLKIIFAVTAIVFLIVLIFLCVKINSLNKQLNTALAANAASGDSATLQLANDQLTQQNTDLKNQVNTLTQQLNGLGAQPGDNTQPTDGTPATAPPATSSPGGSTPATAKPDATTTPASPGAGKTYTVVGGDTLSKIAQNEYGSSSKDNIQKIVDANGITDPNSLKVGQVLTIPAQ